MTKAKFGRGFNYIDFPESLPDALIKQLVNIRLTEFDNRFFYKKNFALTNVERHIWTDVENPFSDRVIVNDFRTKMLKAYGTDRDNRYGVYLDNGWFYVYRSNHLLLRYKLSHYSDFTYRITNLQISNDDHARVEDLNEVLYSLSSKSSCCIEK